MKVVDARSGKELEVGQVVHYPAGEWLRLDAVYDDLVYARAMISRVTADWKGNLVADTFVTRLKLRFLHPGFLFQRVGFIES